MTQKQIQRQSTTTTIQDLPIEDSPAVIAYRVGKLEEAVSTGFSSVNDKLDKLGGFVTKEDAEQIVKAERERADAIHEDLDERLTDVETWREKIVTNIAKWTVIALVLMVLALYGLDKFFKI